MHRTYLNTYSYRLGTVLFKPEKFFSYIFLSVFGRFIDLIRLKHLNRYRKYRTRYLLTIGTVPIPT
jgi:hypothetical protein